MSTIGFNISIDVTKLDKKRFYEGKNGAQYVSLTCFMKPSEPDAYGQHGGIKISATKEEKDAGKDKELPFVGNVKAFWGEGIEVTKDSAEPKQQQSTPQLEDIPF
jgi:hypothetical protein